MRDPLIVMIAGRSPLRPRGGLETFVRAHALAASRAGYDVHVFCLAARAAQRQTEWGVLHEVRTPVLPRSSLMATLHAPFVRRAVVDRVMESGARGPIVVHGFGALSAIGAATCRRLSAAGLEAVPVASAYTTLVHEQQGLLRGVRREHGLLNWVRYGARYLWARSVADRSEGRGYSSSRLVLVNYDAVAELLVRSFGADLEIRRIPYASDLAFHPQPSAAPLPTPIARLTPAQAPLILSISRHDPRKGLDVLLCALQGLVRAGVPFRACLVGLGPTLAASRTLLAGLGLEGQVAITGHVPDVGAYLRHADVFVLPSLEEGGGSLSLLEALQNGVPIVASRCDGIPEDVRAEAGAGTGASWAADEAAVLVEPGDQQGLEMALARVVGDAALRSRLGSRARSIFEQRFSSSALIDALSDAYVELGVGPA